MRKLATIVKIDDIKPIPGADKIVVASIKGWQVVVKKDEFQIGDKAIYFEIDSFLPVLPQYEFLRKSCFRTMADGSTGHRLKTIKLKGQRSQGLLLPLNFDAELGDDVTEILGVKKYEPPIPAVLSGDAKSGFPGDIPRTDEERIQNYIAEMNLSGQKLHMTEKLDGSSATFYIRNGEFGVCSRNLELRESDKNAFWIAARAYGIEDKLRALGGNWAIQGELLGPGIQGNSYKLMGFQIYVFNLFNITERKYYSYEDAQKMLPGLNFVPSLGVFQVPEYDHSDSTARTHTVSFILDYANGKSQLADVSREGIVFRSGNKEISFKAISNIWLEVYEQ